MKRELHTYVAVDLCRLLTLTMPSAESLPLKSDAKAATAHFRSTADFFRSSQDAPPVR